ncbi:MAG: hypothetical protein IVW57_02680, partial [Ktedonobacterales bacterium]|nr:hypothetical protein [Ktedonobacterales bacterium]
MRSEWGRHNAWGITLGLLSLLFGAWACGTGPIPVAGQTPSRCAANCPPPQRKATSAHTIALTHFRLTYFDPWTVASSNDRSVLLVAQTQFGEVSVEFASMTVTPGTTAAQVLATAVRQVVDPNQFTDAQDTGAINGAEIGY